MYAYLLNNAFQMFLEDEAVSAGYCQASLHDG